MTVLQRLHTTQEVAPKNKSSHRWIEQATSLHIHPENLQLCITVHNQHK